MTGFTLKDSAEFDEWQCLETESLRCELNNTLARIVDYGLTLGDHEATMPFAQRWAFLNPLDELPQIALMQLYIGNGQRTTALKQYKRYVQLLKDELHTMPSSKFIDLYKTLQTDPHTLEIFTAQYPHLHPTALRYKVVRASNNLSSSDPPSIGRDLNQTCHQPFATRSTILIDV
jgi:DNA-binding SARP family transcriptional activator